MGGVDVGDNLVARIYWDYFQEWALAKKTSCSSSSQLLGSIYMAEAGKYLSNICPPPAPQRP